MILASACSVGSSSVLSPFCARLVVRVVGGFRLAFFCRGLTETASPSSLRFSGCCQLNRAAFLQHVEGGVPEFQVQDFAFLRQQVVVDPQAVKRAQESRQSTSSLVICGYR